MPKKLENGKMDMNQYVVLGTYDVMFSLAAYLPQAFDACAVLSKGQWYRGNWERVGRLLLISLSVFISSGK